ncbi:helix-turn-helix domain-containing protein [Citrobacter sp. JGM124]|uniref:AraC family transcriptional regulator n=1 Tax=Citrobacter sp. JGM124 TaxID=2799789 RepID=UPI001BA6455D|nr:helix-turn-helix domain-containing protein [Citrobacter sp. JGM124]MBS0848120.1 helix-turn-helix domain-containing protein [Citrobacter sp. JGM124]
MPRPSALYVPHIMNAENIQPEERVSQISQNLNCYGIDVVNNRRPEEIIAHHKTISGVLGDYCSAHGSSNETIYDPHTTQGSAAYISVILHGQQRINTRKADRYAQINQGTLILHERNDYYHYQCTDVKQLYILPYPEQVKGIFDGRLNQPAISLEHHHLATFLKSHMLLLDAQSAHLDSKSTALIVDGLHNMALLMMLDIAKEQGLMSEGKRHVIFNGAKSYIQQNFSQHDLSPDLISKVLRCSRASLDRAFNEQNTSVMLVIKNIRLNAAREMLENNNKLRIEQISWRCGFVSHSLFSKLFREKYYTSPTSWRDNFKGAFQPENYK